MLRRQRGFPLVWRGLQGSGRKVAPATRPLRPEPNPEPGPDSPDSTKAERGEAAAEEQPEAGRGGSGGSGKGAVSTARKCGAKRQAGRKARGPRDTHPFGGDTTAFSRKTPAGPSEPERGSPCPGLTPSSGADAAVTWTGSRGSVTVRKTRGPRERREARSACAL